MDIDKEIEDAEMRSLATCFVAECQDLFKQIREFTDSEVCAWYVVMKWKEWQFADRLLKDVNTGAEKLVTEAQLGLLNKKGMVLLK